jgi:hypothetical protein
MRCGKKHKNGRGTRVPLCHVYMCTSIRNKGNKIGGINFVLMASFLFCVLLGGNYDSLSPGLLVVFSSLGHHDIG